MASKSRIARDFNNTHLVGHNFPTRHTLPRRAALRLAPQFAQISCGQLKRGVDGEGDGEVIPYSSRLTFPAERKPAVSPRQNVVRIEEEAVVEQLGGPTTPTLDEEVGCGPLPGDWLRGARQGCVIKSLQAGATSDTGVNVE